MSEGSETDMSPEELEQMEEAAADDLGLNIMSIVMSWCDREEISLSDENVVVFVQNVLDSLSDSLPDAMAQARTIIKQMEAGDPVPKAKA